MLLPLGSQLRKGALTLGHNLTHDLDIDRKSTSTSAKSSTTEIVHLHLIPKSYNISGDKFDVHVATEGQEAIVHYDPWHLLPREESSFGVPHPRRATGRMKGVDMLLDGSDIFYGCHIHGSSQMQPEFTSSRLSLGWTRP
jgi:hypothetical protein